MKIALITDQHFGARGDHQVFDSFFRTFYDKIFFPVLDELEIKHVVDLGDTFDRRKFVNFLSLANAREYYFDKLAYRNISLDLLVGNHCTFYKNTNKINSPRLLLGEFPNVRIFEEATQVQFDGLDILYVPWICADNYAATKALIKSTIAEVVFGHLELDGFEMYRGQPCVGGESPATFNRFDQVFSGHFHHRATKGNVTYLGNPYELTWSDYDDPRGFHIYDTDTRQLTFIQNPYRMFHKVIYDDTTDTDYRRLPVKGYAERFVKVLVVNKTDFLKFDTFIDRLYQAGPTEIKIIENMTDYDEGALDDSIDVEDTPTMLAKYVDSTETDLDKTRLKSLLQSLYVEAQSLEQSGA